MFYITYFVDRILSAENSMKICLAVYNYITHYYY